MKKYNVLFCALLAITFALSTKAYSQEQQNESGEVANIGETNNVQKLRRAFAFDGPPTMLDIMQMVLGAMTIGATTVYCNPPRDFDTTSMEYTYLGYTTATLWGLFVVESLLCGLQGIT